MRGTFAIALVVVATSSEPAMAETFSGPAEVIDGDTLTVGGRKVRLFGIDAPELAQTCDRAGEAWACGESSSNQLRELIGSSPVECTGNEVDQYARLVAVCHAGGYELNRTMVEYGWAVAFRTYSDDYVADETRAKIAKRGIWASTFDLPQNYRLAQTEAQEPVAPSARARREQRQQASRSACVIKGNHSRRGEWIYHLPGMPYYDATRAEEMFCSEAEAQAAGYRRAIVR